jgi:hypothetical protein
MAAIAVLFIVWLPFNSDAQTESAALSFTMPRNEFDLQMSDKKATLQHGETLTLHLNVLRSKSFQKADARFQTSSTLPEGLVVNFDPSTGKTDVVKVNIVSMESLKPGNYNIVLSATIRNVTKGLILNLTVN